MANQDELICYTCQTHLNSKEEIVDCDFCVYCTADPEEPAFDPEDDEDNPSTMEDPSEAAYDRIVKQTENGE